MNGKQIDVKKLCLNDTLNRIAELISDKINDFYMFTLENGDKIGLSDESYIIVEEIIEEIALKKINL